MRTASGSGRLPLEIMCSKSSPPSTYSSTRYLRKSRQLKALHCTENRRTYSSPRFSQTSKRLMIFGCSINFMMTTSLSIPNGIILFPSFRTIVSITAKLVLRSISADFLLTILIAASLPVIACLAFLTLPEEPLPIVFPNRHGPTCVFRLDFPDALVDVLDT